MPAPHKPGSRRSGLLNASEAVCASSTSNTGTMWKRDRPTSLPAASPRSRRSAPPCVISPITSLSFTRSPENDKWWGAGFTEWNNVTRALPRYLGHRQPKAPADLGFYDLSAVEILRRQAALARRAGIHGFCIHNYWFSGEKLLETPLQTLLANPDIDLRFCLNWANENWSRRWDGNDKEILMHQRYAPGEDAGYARSILDAVKDPRYIRINGRPLIMFYRPNLLPDAKAAVQAWRKVFLAEGVGDPYVVMAQAFDATDPTPYGIDATAGFPPHGGGFDLPNDASAPNCWIPISPASSCPSTPWRGGRCSTGPRVSAISRAFARPGTTRPGERAVAWASMARHRAPTAAGCGPRASRSPRHLRPRPADRLPERLERMGRGRLPRA